MAEQRRKITTVRQLELLVDFLEGHQDLALGRVRSKEARALADRLWRECAAVLNLEGPSRTSKEWAKVYSDYKVKVRGKLLTINKNLNATGGGPSSAPNLSPIEERLANLIGRDVGPLPNVRQEIFNVMEDPSIENTGTEQGAVGEPHSPVFPLESMGQIPAPPPASPAPSERGRYPTPSPRPSPLRRRQINRAARARQPMAARPLAQSNRSALDESRQMVLKIEQMRAEANLVLASAMDSFSRSFESIAHGITAVCTKVNEPEGRRRSPEGKPSLTLMDIRNTRGIADVLPTINKAQRGDLTSSETRFNIIHDFSNCDKLN